MEITCNCRVCSYAILKRGRQVTILGSSHVLRPHEVLLLLNFHISGGYGIVVLLGFHPVVAHLLKEHLALPTLLRNRKNVWHDFPFSNLCRQMSDCNEAHDLYTVLRYWSYRSKMQESLTASVFASTLRKWAVWHPYKVESFAPHVRRTLVSPSIW